MANSSQERLCNRTNLLFNFFFIIKAIQNMNEKSRKGHSLWIARKSLAKSIGAVEIRNLGNALTWLDMVTVL